MNGALFLGSILFFEYIILTFIFHKKNIHFALWQSTLSFAYYLFWIYPICILSYILCNRFYSDIGNASYFIFVGHPRPSSDNVFNALAISSFRLCFLGIWFLLTLGLSFLPIVGRYLSFLSYAWMSSYYCFEYGWTCSGLNLEKRLELLELRAFYHLGFGFSITLVSFLFFSPLNQALYALLFPFVRSCALF